MMYISYKKDLHLNTANNPVIPQTTLFNYHFTPNHLFYLFSLLITLFIYYLKWNGISKMFDSSE